MGKQDAFRILECKEIRIQSSRGPSSAEAGDLDEEGGESGGAAARGRAITQGFKKGLIQSTIPVFIELKRLLQGKNSPLTGSLMECLRILLKDYKNEIDEILVADKQLQKELIYDMQKFESLKAKSTASEAVANMQRSESYRSPAVSAAAAAATETNVRNKEEKKKIPENLRSAPKMASAMADAAAEATARSVLMEVNQGGTTPPLSAMTAPKLKTSMGSGGDKPSAVLESLRRRHCFDSDEEN